MIAGCLRHAKSTLKASCILCTKGSWQVQLNSTETFTSKSELVRTLDLKRENPKGFTSCTFSGAEGTSRSMRSCSRFLKYEIDPWTCWKQNFVLNDTLETHNGHLNLNRFCAAEQLVAAKLTNFFIDSCNTFNLEVFNPISLIFSSVCHFWSVNACEFDLQSNRSLWTEM